MSLLNISASTRLKASCHKRSFGQTTPKWSAWRNSFIEVQTVKSCSLGILNTVAHRHLESANLFNSWYEIQNNNINYHVRRHNYLMQEFTVLDHNSSELCNSFWFFSTFKSNPLVNRFLLFVYCNKNAHKFCAKMYLSFKLMGSFRPWSFGCVHFISTGS